MARSDDSSTVKIKAPIPMVIGRITEQNARSGTCGQFGRCIQRLIRDAQAGENPKVFIIWWGA
jgi:hypothetical protein